MIELPNSIREQSHFAAKMALEKHGVKAPVIDVKLGVDESTFDDAHYHENKKLYSPPDPDLVKAMFEQLKEHDDSYTDRVIAKMMGVADDRTVRRWRRGDKPVAFVPWRKFLVATGRAPIDVPEVVGLFK